jgi:putative ABC transport system permease protein
MARVPVTQALSGRPPHPRPARRSLVLAIALIAGGVTGLLAGIDATKDEANAGLVIVGVLAIPLGIALLCPLAVRALAPAAAHLPVAPRLAVRDLVRYQARAGAGGAGRHQLGLGIAVSIVVAATAAEYRPDEATCRTVSSWSASTYPTRR